MISQYILFYVLIAFLLIALLNLFIIINIRVTGETIFYRLDLKNPEHKKYKEKYKKRASGKWLLVNILAILLVVALLIVEARAIADKHVVESGSTLVIGSALVIFAGLGTLYALIAVFSNRKPNRSSKRGKDDGSWLV